MTVEDDLHTTATIYVDATTDARHPRLGAVRRRARQRTRRRRTATVLAAVAIIAILGRLTTTGADSTLVSTAAPAIPKCDGQPIEDPNRRVEAGEVLVALRDLIDRTGALEDVADLECYFDSAATATLDAATIPLADHYSELIRARGALLLPWPTSLIVIDRYPDGFTATWMAAGEGYLAPTIEVTANSGHWLITNVTPLPTCGDLGIQSNARLRDSGGRCTDLPADDLERLTGVCLAHLRANGTEPPEPDTVRSLAPVLQQLTVLVIADATRSATCEVSLLRDGGSVFHAVHGHATGVPDEFGDVFLLPHTKSIDRAIVELGYIPEPVPIIGVVADHVAKAEFVTPEGKRWPARIEPDGWFRIDYSADAHTPDGFLRLELTDGTTVIVEQE